MDASELKAFIEQCKFNPSVLSYPSLSFFRDYIQSLGGNIPLSGGDYKAKSHVVDEDDEDIDNIEDKPQPPHEEDEPNLVESDIELDESDVVDPDNDPPQKMGDLSVEVSEENRDASQEAKCQAMEAISEGKLEVAIEHLTTAILLNPTSAIMYGIRASVYIKMKKPNAAVRDATAALEINPDSAKGYKSRGIARAMLGQWEEAAKDLHLASKLDYDEEISVILKKVEPNAHKIGEHRMKYDRLRKEREERKVERESHRRRAEAQNSFQEELQIDTNALNNPQGWSEQEDIALMSAWCFVSTNAIVGTNQTSAKLWKPILNLYEQGRADTPGMGVKRTSESLRNRFKRLNRNVTKWIDAYKKAHDRATSGQSKEDIEKTAQQLYGNSKFNHHVVFERVMRHNPKWELKLNSTGLTRFNPDEDGLEESRGSSKRSKTSEDVEPQINSTTGSDSSRLQCLSGRDKSKASAKRKGKEVASQSYPIPDDFTATLCEMRLTREKECEIQERKIKTSTLNTLIAKSDLSPEEEALKRHLMTNLYGM